MFRSIPQDMHFAAFFDIFMAEKLPMVNLPKGEVKTWCSYQDPYLSSVEEGLSLAHQKMLLFLWYEEVRGNIVVLLW